MTAQSARTSIERDRSILVSSTALREKTTPILALCLLGIEGLYKRNAVSLVSMWARSETYNHGLVMLPISMYLVWRRRADIFEFVPTRKGNIETDRPRVFDGSVQYTEFPRKECAV